MNKLVYLNELFDLYGELLTEKQQKYFKDYYFNNLSYGDSSAQYNVSRNAIFHQLRITQDKLKFYEEKLNLYTKKRKINDIIDMINDKKIQKELSDLF